MHKPNPFNLDEAIEAHIREINYRNVLQEEECDEIFDHLLSDTETFMAEGLSEREAFALSIKSFGDTELISYEFERSRPFWSLKSQLVTGLMLFFTVLFITQFIHNLTILTFLAGDHFHWTPQTGQLFDLGLKMLILGGFSSYLVYRIKNYPYFRKIELWLLPLFGTVLPYIMGQFWYLVHDPTGLYTYQKDMLMRMTRNSDALSLAGIALLTIIYFIRRFKARKREPAYLTEKKRPVLFLSFFYLLILHAGIRLMDFLSFHGAKLMGIAKDWISNFDLAMKSLFVAGFAIYLFRQLGKQKPFGQLEAWLLPLLALPIVALVDYRFLFFDMIDPAARKFMRIGIVNSWTINVLTLFILVVMTFVMVAQEQRRLTRG